VRAGVGVDNCSIIRAVHVTVYRDGADVVCDLKLMGDIVEARRVGYVLAKTAIRVNEENDWYEGNVLTLAAIRKRCHW